MIKKCIIAVMQMRVSQHISGQPSKQQRNYGNKKLNEKKED